MGSVGGERDESPSRSAGDGVRWLKHAVNLTQELPPLMPPSPLELLSQVARIPKAERLAERDELKARYAPKLATTLQRDVLACLLGEPCLSAAAQAWAQALLDESEIGSEGQSRQNDREIQGDAADGGLA